MSFEFAGQIVVALLGLASATIPFLGARAQQKSQNADLNNVVTLVNAVSADTQVRQRLEAHVEQLVIVLLERSQYRRRPVGIVLGLMFIALATACGIAAVRAGGVWLWALIPVVFVFILGAVGTALDSTKGKRDAKGKLVT